MNVGHLIGQVLLGNMTEDEALRKATCTMVASRKMWCDGCHCVLDEKSIVVYEMSDQILGACCPKCAEIVQPTIDAKYPSATKVKWDI